MNKKLTKFFLKKIKNNKSLRKEKKIKKEEKIKKYFFPLAHSSKCKSQRRFEII